MTTFSTTLVVVVLAAAWAFASPLQVSCALAAPYEQIQQAPGESAAFVNAINQLRAGLGLNPLSVDGELSAVANDWAVEMAKDDGISHRLDLKAGISALWRTLGENVGFGPTVGQLMDAFIASPGHYKNLVDPRFTHIGVGTVRVGELLYTAHEFMGLQSDSQPVIATPPPTAAPKPKVTAPAPQVTAPPVTTPPTTAAPAPTTVPTVQTTIERLAADHQLDNSSQDDHEKQQSKSNGRCRSHNKNLQSLVL